jgi:hypothetical protein
VIMWRSDIKDWEKLDLPVYQLCLSESDKILKEALDDDLKITDRAYTLINVLSPIIIILIGFILNRLWNPVQQSKIIWIATLFLCVLGYCIAVLSKLIKTRFVYRSGTEPKEILQSNRLDKATYTEQEKLKFVLLFVIEQNQHKISCTESSNRMRTKKYNTVIFIVLTTLFVFFLLILGIIFLRYHQ